MSDKFSSRIEAAKRAAELRDGPPDQTAAEPADGLEFEESEEQAFSTISADRQQKLMVEFRFLDGNAKALPYYSLAAADFNPSSGIVLDFSAYRVKIKGRRLRPLFEGLVTQRVAVVRQLDELHAAASGADRETIVTRIEIEEI